MEDTEGSSKEIMQGFDWDPKSPSVVLLPTVQKDSTVLFSTALAHDGVGCSKYETSALMELLEPQDSEKKSSSKMSSIPQKVRHCRRVLHRCIDGWEDHTMEKGEMGEVDEVQSVELLKLMHAVTHLSQIYLFSRQPSALTRSTNSNAIHSEGSATAETVRYLRLHHMTDVLRDVLETFESSSHPEQNLEYWTVMEALFVRGCLDEAWALLSRHSLHRRAFEDSASKENQMVSTNTSTEEYYLAMRRQDQQGFQRLRALLLSAPLPGGRTDWFDDSDDRLEEDGEDDNTKLLDGLERTDYKLWENSALSGGSSIVGFSRHAALTAHRAWVRAVKDTDFAHIVKRLPQLRPCLSVLKGDFTNTTFASWSEELCAELIYVRPTLRPEDIPRRAESIMRKHRRSTEDDWEGAILSVMRGNAGRAVEILHRLGGGSGAALPATLTSMMCNYLMDAELLPQDEPSKQQLRKIGIDLLLSASEAIIASHALNGKDDIGIRLSTLLLLPFATPSGDERVPASLGESLSHYSPKTDTEAKLLIDLVVPLVKRKSLYLVDGCISMVMSMYRYYLGKQHFAGAMHWLIRGMEVEMMAHDECGWNELLASTTCCRLIVTSCTKASHALLTALLDGSSQASDQVLAQQYTVAREMMDSALQDEAVESVTKIPEFSVLCRVVDVAKAIMGIEELPDDVIAKKIVECLEGKIVEDGAELRAACASLHAPLMKLALDILERDEKRYKNEGAVNFGASFDVHGIHILMERDLQVRLGWKEDDGRSRHDDSVSDTNLALCHGLSRAFVTENATRKTLLASSCASRKSLLSVHVNEMSPSEQEHMMEQMLGDF